LTNFPVGRRFLAALNSDVYILYAGNIRDIWTEKDRIFNIGGTCKEGLETRIGKHRSALRNDGYEVSKKLRKTGRRLGKALTDISASYYVLDESKPDYLPFVLESHLLTKYETMFGEKPECNSGSR
jgi:hypothetical protein